MWTILRTLLGGLTDSLKPWLGTLVSLLLAFALSVVGVKYWMLKHELDTTLHSLRLASSELGTCRVTVDTYLSLSARLEKERQQALAAANQVSVRTRQLITKSKQTPASAPPDDILKQKLSTAREAADLWNQ